MWYLILLLVIPSHGFDRVPANIMNRYDFMKAEIKAMDWTRQICPKTITQNELPECKRCYTEDTCTMSMVGFESRVARIDPSKDIDPTTSTTVLAASFIGAPTFVAGNFESNGTSTYSPSFMGEYTAPETRDTFWNVVGSNSALRAPGAKLVDLTSPPYVYSSAWYQQPKGIGDTEINLIVILKEIIEFDDKNNNGLYDSVYDGETIQVIATECLSWSLPKKKISFNKTVAFSGETQSWSTSTKAFKREGAAFEKCQRKTMPENIPANMLSFEIETSNLPVVPENPSNTYDQNPTNPMIVTQNGMRIKINVKDFPFRNTNTTGKTPVKSRLAFRFYITCDDYNSQFALFDQRRLANRKKPSNLDNGYFEWQPNARVKFPGSDAMFSGQFKEQPLKPSRRMSKDASLPGESAKDGFIPHLGDITEIPYSATTEKIRHAYENAWIEDLVLAVGGQAYNPSEIEFEMTVAYGAQPVFKTWAGQPAIVIGTLLCLVIICWCTYGGWSRERDLQTGYSAADASEEALIRTARELHDIKLTSQDGAHVSLLKKAKLVKPHLKEDEQGVHFVCFYPCRCRVFKTGHGNQRGTNI